MMGVKQIKAVRMLRQEGHPIKEICRKTGISRNTVTEDTAWQRSEVHLPTGRIQPTGAGTNQRSNRELDKARQS